MCAHDHVCAGAHLCTWVWKPEASLWYGSSVAVHLILGQFLTDTWDSPIRLGWLTSKPFLFPPPKCRDHECVCATTPAGITHVHATTPACLWCWQCWWANLGPCVYAAEILPTELSPELLGLNHTVPVRARPHACHGNAFSGHWLL